MEAVNLDIHDFDPPMNIRFADEPSAPSFSSGGMGEMGLEMLMNDKHRSSSSGKTSVDMRDLDRMDTEMDGLSEPSRRGNTKVLSGLSDMFGFNSPAEEPHFTSEHLPTDSNIGHATAGSSGGYTRPKDKEISYGMSERERHRKKLSMLKSLEMWSEKGLIKYSSRFDSDSSYEEIEDEFDSAIEDKNKQNTINMGSKILGGMAQAIEWMNATANPFDINLDGWAEKVSEELEQNSYDDIFGELHEKYKGGKISPELSLVMRLGMSASMVVGMNSMMKKIDMPEITHAMRQNPAFMKSMSAAVSQAMETQIPSLSMASQEPQPNMSYGPPPAPIETQQYSRTAANPGMMYTQNTGNRPDIIAGRGTMFRESGVDINNVHGGYSDVPDYAPRAEMRGPQNAFAATQNSYSSHSGMMDPTTDSILSGLKMMPGGGESFRGDGESFRGDGDSVISVSSMRDMNDAIMPKRAARRKPRSEKNVLSLDGI